MDQNTNKNNLRNKRNRHSSNGIKYTNSKQKLKQCHSCKGYFPISELRAVPTGFTRMIGKGKKHSYCYYCSYIYRNPAHWVRIQWRKITVKKSHALILAIILTIFSPLFYLVYFTYSTLLLTLYFLFLIPFIPFKMISEIFGGTEKGSNIPRKTLTLLFKPGVLGDSLKENHDLWWEGKLGIKDWGTRMDALIKNTIALLFTEIIILEAYYWGVMQKYILNRMPLILAAFFILYLALSLYYWIRNGFLELSTAIFFELFNILKVVRYNLFSVPKARYPKTFYENVVKCCECGNPLTEKDDVVMCDFCGSLFHSKELYYYVWKDGICPSCKNICFPKKVKLNGSNDKFRTAILIDT